MDLSFGSHYYPFIRCAVVEEASHWQRHSDNHLPGVGLRPVLSPHHSLSLPAHLHSGACGEPQHQLYQVQVRRVQKECFFKGFFLFLLLFINFIIIIIIILFIYLFFFHFAEFP